MGSFGWKSDTSQKRADAPMARNVKRTVGGTAAELAMSLHSTTFRPNMVYAAAMDKCPFNWSVAVSFINAKLVKLFFNSVASFVFFA